MKYRLQKIIASAGVCSRRKAEELIRQGKVKVNGELKKVGDKADIFIDEIIVDGKKLSQPEKVYLAFNKPPDCLTTLHDPKGRKTILEYIKIKERVIPVGRLDFKTQGLIFLTNDGDFANKVMHPRYEVEKTYMVFLDRKVVHEDVEKLKSGVKLDDYTTRPAKVRYGSPAHDVIEITIHEGQNRVVRNMMAALGYNVKRLIRVKIGNVELGDIAQGRYRKLSHREVQQFLKQQPHPLIKENI